MSAIFDNAIDSLKVGIKFYLDETFPTAHKHAIISIFHSIELFLKEKLYRTHPLFIYKNIDIPISDNSQTVGLKEIIVRLSNLDTPLDPKQEKILKELQRKRNRIEHHRFEAEDSDFHIIGKALKFLYYFLPAQLHCSLEEHLDDELYRNVREVILEYDERLAEAEREVNERTTPKTKDDLASPTYSAFCPECDNHTVVIETEKGDFCFFCLQEVSMAQCNWCGGYFSTNEVSDFNMCNDCFADQVRKS